MNTHEFAELLTALRALATRDVVGGAALATLVHTKGPVFRRAGARMLVLADGQIVRGLSAGCPEADIIERAREVIATGEARLLRYDREHGYDSLLELGCGGEMEVLVEPVADARACGFAEAIAKVLQTRRPARLATVFSHDGRCLHLPQRLVFDQASVLDELADRALADWLMTQLGSTAPAARSELLSTATRSGEYRVLLETLFAPLRLLLIGVNTTAFALARLGLSLGWQVEVLDHREHAAEPPLPPGVRLLRSDAAQLQQRVAPDARTAVVVMTHNLERDLDYLRALRTQSLVYLGALGSRARAAKMQSALGACATALHAPAGLDIGSETPEEIALAIAAEIQGSINGHHGGQLRESAGPIH